MLVIEFFLKRFFLVGIFCYGLLCLYAFFFSNPMIFPVPPVSYKDTGEILKLRTGNGLQISALYLPNSQARYTLLYSHGNGEDLGMLVPTMRSLYELGFSIFAYDYQGYGTSEGTPAEGNTYQDIDAAYRYLTQTLGIPADQIIVYGRSIGSGPSVDLASRKPVAGLILETPFLTVFRVVTNLPIVPFDRFNNLQKITQVQCPVLIIHGTPDEVVPFFHGEQLFKAANEPKRFLRVESAAHHNISWVAGERYEMTLQDFVDLVAASPLQLPEKR